MNALLTGSQGMLGSAIRRCLETPGSHVTPLRHDFVWGTNRHDLARLFAGHSLLIHAAANTNVEGCEADPERCYRDNLLLTELLADLSLDVGIRMVFVSSTGVYGSSQASPYREFDPTNPTTHHHRAKQLAEEAVLSRSGRNLVVRTGWLFGGAVDNPKNFVARRMDEARAAVQEHRNLKSNAEQWGNPCYCDDVAARLLELACREYRGIFNCVNDGSASRLEYVSEIVRLSGLHVNVVASKAEEFRRIAKVSDNEAALNWKMSSFSMPPMRHWKSALEEYIATLPRAESA